MIDGGVWANTPVAVAVVEAMTMLDWDPQSLHVLSLGCGDEIFSPRVQGGAFAYGSDAIDIILQGQSAGALAMATHLMNDRESNRLVRISPSVPKGTYSLDGCEAIPRLRGLGASLAREFTGKARDVFFDSAAEPFVPFPTAAIG